jgi:hypothetical protein
MVGTGRYRDQELRPSATRKLIASAGAAVVLAAHDADALARVAEEDCERRWASGGRKARESAPLQHLQRRLTAAFTFCSDECAETEVG